MIKNCPIKPIYLALLVSQIYLIIYQTSLLTIGLLAFSLVALICQYHLKSLTKILLILFGFACYFTVLHYHSQKIEEEEPNIISTIQPIPDSIVINGDLLSFRGTHHNHLYQAYYRLTSEDEKTFFQNLTDLVQLDIEAQLEEPETQRNFQGFDCQSYLKTQGIYRLTKIKQIRSVKFLNTFNPIRQIQKWRRKLLVFIQNHFPAPMKHYMTGLLLGYLDKEFEQMSDLYSQLGIIHLFALSGMQVGFFVKRFRYLLLRLGLTQEEVDMLQIPFSIIYAGLTGFAISVNRSLIQAVLKQTGLKGLDNLATTLLLLFILMPHKVMTAGGVLSFAYAFILTTLSFEGLPKMKATLYQTLSLALGVLPLLCWYFSSFQPLSILLTAILSLLFDSLMLPVLSLVLIVSPVIIINQINPLFTILENLITAFGKLAGQAWIFGSPSPFLLLILLVLLGILADRVRLQQKKLPLILLLSLCFSLVKYPLDNEVTVIDIGQGDSIFIRDMTGKTILIDVGGKLTFPPKDNWQRGHYDTNAERTLIPYLKSRGVGQIDYLILTHTDTDHIGDMEVVCDNFKIKNILVSPGSLTQEDFANRLKKLNKPVKAVKAGESLDIMASQLHFLYPIKVGDGSNDDSLVLYGQLLNKTFLFTGDLEEHGEETLVKTYPNLRVDILKAGHHGSKGSSQENFLDHIKPKIALISAGNNNRYKHPHPETLDRFKQRHISIYRTDQEGAIRFHGWLKWQIETVRTGETSFNH